MEDLFNLRILGFHVDRILLGDGSIVRSIVPRVSPSSAQRRQEETDRIQEEVEPKPQEKAVKLKDKLGICWKKKKKKNIDNHCHRCKKEETQTIYLILTYIYISRWQNRWLYLGKFSQLASNLVASSDVILMNLGMQLKGCCWTQGESTAIAL